MDLAIHDLIRRTEEAEGKKGKKSAKKSAKSANGESKKTVKAEKTSKPKELPEKTGTEKKKEDPLRRPKGSIVYKCSQCDDMTKVLSPSCRACEATNGYQPTPPGTRLPKKKHGAVKQAGGMGSAFGGDDMFGGGSGGGGGKKGDDDDDDEFDPDNVPDVTPIGDVEDEERVRISTGIKAFDRVLGGSDEEGYGIVAGSSVLLDGSPGIGKSTLLIQALAKLAEHGVTLYVTGEEAASDIKARARRLGILSKKVKKNLLVVETTNPDAIINIIEEEEPSAVILDSIQMFYADDVSGQAGSEPQCKYILEELIRGTTKPMGIALFVVSQVTKDGDARGPQTIAHMVDAHCKFESVDPKNKGETKRVLYAKKNRNGDIAIISHFRMTSEGLKGLKPGSGGPPMDPEMDSPLFG